MCLDGAKIYVCNGGLGAEGIRALTEKVRYNET